MSRAGWLQHMLEDVASGDVNNLVCSNEAEFLSGRYKSILMASSKQANVRTASVPAPSSEPMPGPNSGIRLRGGPSA